MRRQKLILPRRDEGPLLVSAPMALATLRKLKTETRRTTGLKEINLNPDRWTFAGFHPHQEDDFASFVDRQVGAPKLVRFPYGRVMDFLWLRENWRVADKFETWKPSEVPKGTKIWFEADGAHPDGFGKLRPSIYLPRWACRARVQLLGIGAERLHQIDGYAALREGVEYTLPTASSMTQAKIDYEAREPIIKQLFTGLWISINGRASWELNPWVWVLRYRLEGLYDPTRFN